MGRRYAQACSVSTWVPHLPHSLLTLVGHWQWPDAEARGRGESRHPLWATLQPYLEHLGDLKTLGHCCSCLGRNSPPWLAWLLLHRDWPPTLQPNSFLDSLANVNPTNSSLPHSCLGAQHASALYCITTRQNKDAGESHGTP